MGLKNWSRPSIAELGVPTESWQHVHNKNQKRFNLHLLAGAGAIAVSLLSFYAMVDLNGTPQFLKKVDYLTITPKTLTSVETQSVTSPSLSEIVVIAEEAVEVAEEVAVVVKDTLDVVKDTIESADEVVEEIKKVEDETLAIIEESKEIIKDGKELVKDVKDVIEEGVEIVSGVKEGIEKIVEEAEGVKEEVGSETELVKEVENVGLNDKIVEGLVPLQEKIIEEVSKTSDEPRNEAVTELVYSETSVEKKENAGEEEALSGDVVAPKTEIERNQENIQETGAIQISTIETEVDSLNDVKEGIENTVKQVIEVKEVVETSVEKKKDAEEKEILNGDIAASQSEIEDIQKDRSDEPVQEKESIPFQEEIRTEEVDKLVD